MRPGRAAAAAPTSPTSADSTGGRPVSWPTSSSWGSTSVDSTRASSRPRGPARSLAIENRLVTLWTLTGLARVGLERGNFERAGRIWGAVSSETERDPVSDAGFDEFAAPLAAETELAFLDGVALGRDDGLEGAVELALAAQ